MIEKTVKNIEELVGFEWECRGKNFILPNKDSSSGFVHLEQKNATLCNGGLSDYPLKSISLENLQELEFYGLKVVLNEKPKVSKEERECIEAEWYIARDDDGKLFFYHMLPKRDEELKEWIPNVKSIVQVFKINRTLFPFITWESGKAWSKAELMKLEVVD